MSEINIKKISISSDSTIRYAMRAIGKGGVGFILVYEETTEKLVSIQGHNDNIMSVFFGQSNETLLSSSWDNSIKTWHDD